MFCVTFYKPFIEHPRGTMNANLRFQDILILKKETKNVVFHPDSSQTV